MSGFFVMKYGGNRYTSVGWYSLKAQADAEKDRILKSGLWSGKPPLVVPDDVKGVNLE